MSASAFDPGVLTLLRRHSTENTLCDNVECCMDDPLLLEPVGSPDEFGYIKHVCCTVCGQVMSTKCYDDAQRRKVRVLSAEELRSGDHIAWHTALGHWHNVIFLESDGMENDGITSRISVIEYRYRGRFHNEVIKSIRHLDFNFVDVYRIIYVDAYTDEYSVERAKVLTKPGINIYRLLGGCEHLARWCKTGHRPSKVSIIVQKISFEKEELNVVHKSSTFLSLALANGLIADPSNKVNVVETVIFTIIPAVVFFFSIVMTQVKREYNEITPRHENLIISGVDGDNPPGNKSTQKSCCCRCCCNEANLHKRCVTYGGALTRVFVRELVATAVPVAVFVVVGFAVTVGMAAETWLVSLIELVSALVSMPLSYAIGVFLGTFVERYCCRCCCASAPVSPQNIHRRSKRKAGARVGPADDHQSVSQLQTSRPMSVVSNASSAAGRESMSLRNLSALAKVTPV